MYEIPKQFRSEIKIAFLFLKDIVVVILSIIFIFTVDKHVHDFLKLPFYLMAFPLVFFLVVPSATNKERRNYHAVLYALMRNRTKYHPIQRVESEEENV